ncbi:MAG: hypothetical protein JO170_25605 [Verrucomicrobia bacterium]|nr:hypothetical protein [Verrucomicrobiota bacterium]
MADSFGVVAELRVSTPRSIKPLALKSRTKDSGSTELADLSAIASAKEEVLPDVAFALLVSSSGG